METKKEQLTKSKIIELLSKLSTEREKSAEIMHRNDGAIGICKFIFETFEFPEEAKTENGNPDSL